jgi:methionyl-tRNA formyltransferase
MEKMRIVFMGTSDFAVASLAKLVENNYQVVGVITSPDKPSGRGLTIHSSAVKQYAVAHGLHVLQPEKLKNETFLAELKALKADLQIVVAFRMLPEVVWNMPPLGTFNLHASLLPQYRGAAPINYAIINGEKETGVTTFFLVHQIDQGNIINQTKCAIEANENAGQLHDKLKTIGSDLVLKTVQQIEKNEITSIPQQSLINDGLELKEAPKIFKETCQINWHDNLPNIYNLIRGLSPYPTAFTNLHTTQNQTLQLKIYETDMLYEQHSLPIGTIVSDEKNYFNIAVADGYISLKEIQLAGKKAMQITDFLRGFKLNTIQLKVL